MTRFRSLAICGLLLFAACSSTPTEPSEAVAPVAEEARAAIPSYDAATFYDTTSIFGSSFSPNEDRILFTSDASGIYNAYSVPVSGGEPVMLTDSTSDAVFAVSWFPGDERFLYTADQAGNELNHLYVRGLDGETFDLTPGENLKASFAGWREDDQAFFVLTNERDPRSFDLYEYDVAEGFPRRLVLENPGAHDISGISRDGRWVVLTKVRNNADNDLFLWDRSRPEDELVHLTPHEGDVSHRFATFTPDGREVYFLSNADSEYDRVWTYDIQQGEGRVRIASSWDITFTRFSRDGRYRVMGINYDGRTVVKVHDTQSGTLVRLPRFPHGDVLGVNFARSGERAAFYVNGDTSPSNLFVLDVDSGSFVQLSDTMSPAVDARFLIESEVVRYPSYDQLEIPALLYKPHQAQYEKVPALVWVHGGPGGQSRVGYNPMIQHLVNHGYAVLAVNNRGSSGYGKTFFHLDDRRHGDVDLKDCIWGRRYLERLDWIDGEHVGIIGGSYGGYMVAAALAFEPEAFDVGIDIFGVTNWLRTLEEIPPWWEDFKDSLYAEMGDPVVDRVRLHARSPLFHAANITKPLLVVQGANDPRVQQAESDELVAAVRQNGVPVEYVLFEDEGHGFRNKQNRIAASEAFLRFADSFLKGDGFVEF